VDFVPLLLLLFQVACADLRSLVALLLCFHCFLAQRLWWYPGLCLGAPGRHGCPAQSHVLRLLRACMERELSI